MSITHSPDDVVSASPWCVVLEVEVEGVGLGVNRIPAPICSIEIDLQRHVTGIAQGSSPTRHDVAAVNRGIRCEGGKGWPRICIDTTSSLIIFALNGEQILIACRPIQASTTPALPPIVKRRLCIKQVVSVKPLSPSSPMDLTTGSGAANSRCRKPTFLGSPL